MLIDNTPEIIIIENRITTLENIINESFFVLITAGVFFFVAGFLIPYFFEIESLQKAEDTYQNIWSSLSSLLYIQLFSTGTVLRLHWPLLVFLISFTLLNHSRGIIADIPYKITFQAVSIVVCLFLYIAVFITSGVSKLNDFQINTIYFLFLASLIVGLMVIYFIEFYISENQLVIEKLKELES